MFKSKLYWKVFANFALLLVIMTAMTVLTLNILSQIQKSYSGATSDIRTLDYVQRLGALLTDVPAAADDYALTGSEEARLIYQKGWKEFDEIYLTIQGNLGDTTLVGTLRNVREGFFQWMNQVGDPKMLLQERTKEGAIGPAFAALTEIGTRGQYLDYARSKQRELRQRIAATQFKNIDLASNLSSSVGTFITLVNVLLAVFAVALGFVLTRSITAPVRILKKGTQNIMAGRFEPVELDRSDELGQLASDFNEMSVMLGNNYNRLNAYSELVTALNTNVDLEDVVNKSLELLCSHSASSVGALYLFDEGQRKLNLAAGYALKGGGQPVKSFGLGEGIPGQCALERQPLEVSEVPETGAFAIDTGLVEVVPRYVTAVPILFRDGLIGVLVLGSMHDFDDLKREIITNSTPQIGVAITNARNNEAAQKLSREIAKKNDELNVKNQELEKAYRVKSDFLASMSHELRTPLNSIIGFSSVLLGPSGDPLTKDQKMALEKVLKNGKHLLQLINDILDFSKIESGRMTINVETDDVPNVISNSLMTIESVVKAKGLEMKQEIEADLPLLKTDILKVKQILVNLLSNAAKFTDKGSIELRAFRKNQMICFAVKDSGIGIEPKNLNLVFEEFQQIESSHSRKYKGTGLGLPISRRLARMMGGDLTVESDYGKGSTFSLTLPPEFKEPSAERSVPAAAPSRPPSPPAPPALRERKPAEPPAAAPKPDVVQTGGARILCVDDDPDAIEILRNYLVPEGYVVTPAHSGDEGLKLARETKPALIMLDIMMPEKDGWQVLRELKHDSRTKDIPVVIHSMIDNKPLALALGAVDVMPKPVEAQSLLSLVQRVCKEPGQYVLVVDENAEYATGLKKLLGNEGFKVQIASSGAAAAGIIKIGKPALIVLDPLMLMKDGFQLLRKLTEDPDLSKIAVVILSGREATEQDREKLMASLRDQVSRQVVAPENMTTVVRRILTKA